MYWAVGGSCFPVSCLAPECQPTSSLMVRRPAELDFTLGNELTHEWAKSGPFVQFV
jgi:hypothetical protein